MAFNYVLYIAEDPQAVRDQDKDTPGESQKERAAHFRLLCEKFQEFTTSYDKDVFLDELTYCSI